MSKKGRGKKKEDKKKLQDERARSHCARLILLKPIKIHRAWAPRMETEI